VLASDEGAAAEIALAAIRRGLDAAARRGRSGGAAMSFALDHVEPEAACAPGPRPW